MEYSIEPSESRTLIQVIIQGGITCSQAMKINTEAHALGRKLGIRRYLMDLTKAVHIDTVVNDYLFAYRDMQKEPEIDRFARVVMLVRPDDRTHDFLVTVANNSGLNITLFRDREDALKYLAK